MQLSDTSNNAPHPAGWNGAPDAFQPEALLELLAAHTPARWAVLTRDLDYILASSQWKQEFGLKEENLTGQNFFDTFAEDAVWEQAFRKALKSEPQEGHNDLRTQVGEVHSLKWEVHPLGQQPVQAAVVFTDSEHPQETTPGTERDSLYRILSEYSLDIVCLHDTDGRYQYVSPSVMQVLGYTPDELVGTRPDALIHPDDLDRDAETPPHTLFGAGSGETVRYRMRHKDGSYLWLETSINLVADEEGEIEYILTSSRDVSESVHAKEALRQTNQVLEQRNRELEDFAYVASHDLQEPLRKIRAFANLLQEDYEGKLDEMGEYYIDRMHDAATRMSRLISDLLAFSRVTTKTRPFQRVDLNEELDYVVTDLELQIAELDGAVEVGDLPLVAADPTQMRQLFQNLVSNALKFHRPDVPPIVRVAEASADEVPEEHEGKSDTVSIVVEDNGIGFDEKYLDRIFSPFERLHRRGEYPGTGMGLAISRRIVERHGGDLLARSTPGEGSTFIVTLPKNRDNNSERMETSEA